MSIQILDCTLRDGGYINDWRFGRKNIMSILDKLDSAKIDIIECGFLTEMVHDKECALFNSVADIEAVLPKRKHNAMYVAMIAMGEKELDPKTLASYSPGGIEGIRLTFHKKEIDKALDCARTIMEKGYHVFMQPVGTVFYSDLELLSLVEQINQLKPYAFYIVDTLGSMYRNDVSHRFYLIDKNMDPAIHLGFHGHNNLQLAFSNAQVLGKIQTKRTLILDATVYGMGRGAGNLPTELITQYINRNIASRYDAAMVMDVYDGYIAAIRQKYEWGYTVPYHIAASNICHPNYASYLINRQTLTMKDIEKIIQSIPAECRALYDQALVEQLYTSFQSKKIDDYASVKEITRLISGKKALVLAPGKTLTTAYNQIAAFIDRQQPYVISVNFMDTRYPIDACFISNHKRMDVIGKELQHIGKLHVILTSNIQEYERSDALYVDYDHYTNDDRLISDNAGLMLLKLLQRCGVQEIFLAGFDGFYPDTHMSEDSPADSITAGILEKQAHISRFLKELSNTLSITFLTPSIYQTSG